MRNNRNINRRMSPSKILLLTVLVLVVAAGGSVAGLYALGVIDLPFLHREPSHVGMVPVPMSGVVIPTYTKVTRDQLINPQTRALNIMWMPKESVTSGILVDIGKIIGRVLDHDKPADYVFTEKDFLPLGTRSGLVAGIPAGKRSLTLDASKLSGVFNLKTGDHLDLLATVPIDATKLTSGRNGSAGAMQAAQAQIAAMQKRACVHVLAEDAVVVEPVTTRQKPISSSSLTSGTTTRTVPVQEIVIAVEPKEVAPITEAIATQVDIECVARSGLPGDPGTAEETPGSDPLAQVKIIDAIHGRKREALVFSASGYPQPAGVPEDQPSTAAGGAQPVQRQQ